MAEKYIGQADDRRYTSDAVDVTFNLKRCIHAGECLKRVSAVFDTKKRPWIQPDQAPADAIAEMIPHCPSGALHYERKDGGAPESIPTENKIVVTRKGPYRITGNLHIFGTEVDIEQETRATLCRCGASEQKPFCDNSHRKIEFDGPVAEIKSRVDGLDAGAPLHIQAYPNGPLEVEGNFEIVNTKGETILQSDGQKVFLCRCGQSANKPFCDFTHSKIEFEAP